MLCISETVNLRFENCEIGVNEKNQRFLRIDILHPKTGSLAYPNQTVILHELKDFAFCPVKAYETLCTLRKPFQSHVLADVNGRSFSTSKLCTCFDFKRIYHTEQSAALTPLNLVHVRPNQFGSLMYPWPSATSSVVHVDGPEYGLK